MKLSNLQEMIQDYERITGETIDLTGYTWEKDFTNDEGRHFKFFPNVGFLFWDLFDHEGVTYFRMLETYGFVSGMVDYVKEVMALNNCTDILTFTTRNPKMHIRKWKMIHHPEFDYEHEGKTYHVLTGTVDNLR